MLGAAASTRISEYRPNSVELQDRSIGSLLAWAKEKGIETPPYVRVIPFGAGDDPPTRNGKPVDAKYFESTRVSENAYIYWDEPTDQHRSVLDRSFGAVVVNIAYDVVQSDERFLHVLAHEVFEIVELKKLFDDCGGRMTAARFYELTEPLATAKNLHWYAWDFADSFIERLRGGSA